MINPILICRLHVGSRNDLNEQTRKLDICFVFIILHELMHAAVLLSNVLSSFNIKNARPFPIASLRGLRPLKILWLLCRIRLRAQ